MCDLSFCIVCEGKKMSKLPENIKHFRLLRGLSQKQLAEKLHRTPNVISNWENGVNSPDVDLLEIMCEIFDITPNQLYGWDPCEELDAFLKNNADIARERDELRKQKQELEQKIKQYTQQLSRRK